MGKRKKSQNRKRGAPAGRQSRTKRLKITAPGKPQEPTYEELSKKLRELVPLLANTAFNNFILIGYRRLPESERDKFDGAEEAPFYFYYFPQLFPAGALIEWTKEDVLKRLLYAMEQKEKEATGSGGKEPESQEEKTE